MSPLRTCYFTTSHSSIRDFTGIKAYRVVYVPPDSASRGPYLRRSFPQTFSVIDPPANNCVKCPREDEAARSGPICPLADTRLPLFLRVSAPRRGEYRRGRRQTHSRGRDTWYALFRVRSVTRWHVMPWFYSTFTLHHTPHRALLAGEREEQSAASSPRRARRRREGHSFSRGSIKVTGFLTLIRARACTGVLFSQRERVTISLF